MVKKTRSLTLEHHSAQFDALLSHMQTSKAPKGMEAAFNASPVELGRAAVKGSKAKKARREVITRYRTIALGYDAAFRYNVPWQSLLEKSHEQPV